MKQGMFSLMGKTALVTGSAAGIEHASCVFFSQAGASVVAIDRDDVGLNSLACGLDTSDRARRRRFRAFFPSCLSKTRQTDRPSHCPSFDRVTGLSASSHAMWCCRLRWSRSNEKRAVSEAMSRACSSIQPAAETIPSKLQYSGPLSPFVSNRLSRMSNQKSWFLVGCQSGPSPNLQERASWIWQINEQRTPHRTDTALAKMRVSGCVSRPE